MGVRVASLQELGKEFPAPLLPFWEKGLGDVELALPEGWASQTRQRFHRLLRNG
jgi:hypothetical protein